MVLFFYTFFTHCILRSAVENYDVTRVLGIFYTKFFSWKIIEFRGLKISKEEVKFFRSTLPMASTMSRTYFSQS